MHYIIPYNLHLYGPYYMDHIEWIGPNAWVQIDREKLSCHKTMVEWKSH